MSLGARLEEVGGRPTGFDYLRILLACAVVAIHSPTLSYGAAYSESVLTLPGLKALTLLILPMFFGLSGFLVSGSLDRSKSLFGFLGLRVIRIYPALTVEVLLSAFILGPTFTSLSVRNYFADPVFLRYLVNVTGHISFYLPGTFSSNPDPSVVNGQLWTVPYELYCYGTLALLAFFGIARRKTLLLVATIGLQVVIALHRLLIEPSLFYNGRFGTHVAGAELIVSFLAGVAVYRFRDHLPWGKKVIFASVASAMVLFSVPAGEYIGVFVAVYATICLGLLNPAKVGLLRGADYSYGVYLYGWPVQQSLVATGDWARSAAINLVVSLIIVFCIAALSWHFIEKPALELRKPLKRLEERWLRLWRQSNSVASSVETGQR